MPKEMQINRYRETKIRDLHLITTDHGSWTALNNDEYKEFISGKINTPELYQKIYETGIIIDEKNKKLILNKLKSKHAFLFQGPSLHIVIPTLRCNLKCKYCQAASKPINEKGYDMDKETARKTVDFIFQSPAKEITIEFQGGEPLVNLDIVKFIIEYALEKNKTFKKEVRFALVTNLTLLREDILDYMNKKGVGLCSSLDGSKQVHDNNRIYAQGSGSYDIVSKWIKKLNPSKEKRRVNCLPTLTKAALGKYKEIIDEYVSLNMDSIWLRFANDIGFTRENPEINITSEEAINFYKNSIRYIIENDLPIKETQASYILMKILTNIDPNLVDLRTPCGAAIGQLLYNYDGKIFSCDEGRMSGDDIFCLGNVNQNFKEIISSKDTKCLIEASFNDNYLCDNCAYKPYCGVCPVCNYHIYGTLIPNLSNDKRCKILKGQFEFIFEKFIFDEKYRKKFFKWAGFRNIPLQRRLMGLFT